MGGVSAVREPARSPRGVMSGGSHDRGHVFVVHGRIEHLTHDAALIPVDRYLDFEDHWSALLGEQMPAEPKGWSSGWGRVDETNNWLVEVGDGDYEKVLKRMANAVADVAQHVSPGLRDLPLVAAPILGVGAGGHGHERGAVIKRLIQTSTRLAEQHQIDIALVTPSASVYAAAQHVRRNGRPGSESPVIQRLAQRARSGDLALFLGAGVSIPAGLPSWTDLIAGLAAQTKGVDPEWLVGLGPTDQAELIQKLDTKRFARRVKTWVDVPDRRPSLLHALLSGLAVDQVVTTNYDVLYERAAGATGQAVQRVLPWDTDAGSGSWILKLHGDISFPESIVLTRRHMVRYDAANKPSAALLQSLLLTKHLLFVGVSFTDDNLIRLVHEVEAYRDEHLPKSRRRSDAPSPFASVIDPAPAADEARAQLWDGRIDWVRARHELGVDSFRSQEILLDQIAMCASRDASWLLDERFEGMLNPEDRELAELARRLRAALPSESDTWRGLVAALDRLGARRA